MSTSFEFDAVEGYENSFAISKYVSNNVTSLNAPFSEIKHQYSMQVGNKDGLDTCYPEAISALDKANGINRPDFVYTSSHISIGNQESKLPVTMAYILKTSPYTIVYSSSPTNNLILKKTDLPGLIRVFNNHAEPFTSQYLK